MLSLPPTVACISVNVHDDVSIDDDVDFDLSSHPWSGAMHWVPSTSGTSANVTAPSML